MKQPARPTTRRRASFETPAPAQSNRPHLRSRSEPPKVSDRFPPNRRTRVTTIAEFCGLLGVDVNAFRTKLAEDIRGKAATKKESEAGGRGVVLYLMISDGLIKIGGYPPTSRIGVYVGETNEFDKRLGGNNSDANNGRTGGLPSAAAKNPAAVFGCWYLPCDAADERRDSPWVELDKSFPGHTLTPKEAVEHLETAAI